MFNIDLYLKRIKLTGVLTPTIENLEKLHLAHLINVPYENFDILRGLPYNLDETNLFQKIILNHRGGYCYELNILFAKLLSELGFQTNLLSASIIGENGSSGPEFDHPVILVSLHKRFIADVGNAKWFHLPICLDDPDYQVQGNTIYRIENNEGAFTLLQRNANGFDIPQYKFTLKPRTGMEFNEMCQFKWTSPESKFTKGYICSRLISPQTRVTLNNTRLITTENGQRREQILVDRKDFSTLLGQYFGKEYNDLLKI
jgi:N-hydroxyarylamine O-acetyltransferase